MTLKALNSRLLYWQSRLNLPEWTLGVGWGTKKEMEGLSGCCIWQAESATAHIRISRSDPAQEETLVHELLHIVLQGHLEEVPLYNVQTERAINRIAAALVATI